MQRITKHWVVSVLTVFLSFQLSEALADPIKTCDQYSREILNEKAGKFAEEIAQAAEKHEVDPELIKSIIAVESCFRPGAYSRKEAAGLMQLIPVTAERFGAEDVFDPAENIDAGTRYLRYLLKRYKGSVTHAIAAYNAGENRVAKDQEEITVPFRETRRYISMVLNAYTKFSKDDKEVKLLLTRWQDRKVETRQAKKVVTARPKVVAKARKDSKPQMPTVYKSRKAPQLRRAGLKSEKSGKTVAVAGKKPLAPTPMLNVHWVGAAARIQVADAAE